MREQYQYIGFNAARNKMASIGVDQSWQAFDLHYTRTESPKAGDIVAWPGEHLGACGIYKGDGESWTITQEHGLMTTKDKPKHAWSLTNG